MNLRQEMRLSLPIDKHGAQHNGHGDKLTERPGCALYGQ